MASKLEKISLYVETIRILLDGIDEEYKIPRPAFKHLHMKIDNLFFE